MTSRIALVTGAGRGIGRAMALGLADAGHQVAVTARSEDQLASLASEIEAAGGQVQVIVADLVEPGAVESVLQQVAEHWGPVEILVNNAGIGSSSDPKPLVEFDDDFWDLTMKLNVTIPLGASVRFCLIELLPNGRGFC